METMSPTESKNNDTARKGNLWTEIQFFYFISYLLQTADSKNVDGDFADQEGQL